MILMMKIRKKPIKTGQPITDADKGETVQC
jgi:hypothetical protein